MHEAAYEGQLEVVKYLISNGADIKAKDNSGDTPLHAASRRGRGRLEIVKYLISKGADIHAKTNIGVTPLRLAS